MQFSDSDIPLAVIAADLARGKKVVIREGSVAEAVMASTCIPGIFVPIMNDDQVLVDGGVVENVPVLSLQEMGAEYIIGVDLNAKMNITRPGNILEVLLNTVNITLMNVTRLQTDKADLILTPDLSDFNLYDTDQVSDLIEKGYQETKDILKKIK